MSFAPPTGGESFSHYADGMLNDRYEILRSLGAGAFGEVFLVRDLLSRRTLALKLFSSHDGLLVDEEQVRREFLTLATLSHPHLVQVYDFSRVKSVQGDRHSGQFFYTMEYIEGTDALTYLNTRVEEGGRAKRIEEICIQSLGALDYVHRQGVIHFDVKPGNLMASEDPTTREPIVHLTDFGLSAAEVESIGAPVRGTLEYMAPELLKGLAADYEIDLYSLGITLYQLLTGSPPVFGYDSR